jgi:hypothetical protein
MPFIRFLGAASEGAVKTAIAVRTRAQIDSIPVMDLMAKTLG